MAATFVVPTDRDLIRRSDIVVSATALTSYTQLNDDGGIETVTSIHIDDVLKGEEGLPETLLVVEPGGEYHGRSTVIPGVPRFVNGERNILFLRQTGPNRWAVAELAVGRFKVEEAGKLAMRDSDITGWDHDLKPFHDRARDATKFVEFIRTESRGGMGKEDYFVDMPKERARASTSLPPKTANVAPYTANSYTLIITGSQGGRWAVFPSAVNFFSGTTSEPGAPGGGTTAINAAFAAWDNDCLSNVNYVYAGADNGTHTQGLHNPDGVNTILFERDLSSFGVTPFTCSGNGYSGTLGIGGITSASGTNSVSGETFSTIVEGDVEMNQGIANCTLLFSNGDFNSAVTHEVGHTLGFRHSDQMRSGSAACSTDPNLECSTNAIMKSFISTGLNAALQTYDQHAVQAVYPGNVCAPGSSCTAPAITGQPQNVGVPAGTGVTLFVGATGTSLTYQWYVGTPGQTGNPVSGGTGSSLNVTPGSTTTYWVRVSNSCGSADSSGAIVTVQPLGVASFYLVTPCRILDTRGGSPIPANGTLTINIVGRCGLPSGIKSLAVNVTAVNPAQDGLVTVYPGPANTIKPNISTINYQRGRTLANNARITVGVDDTINMYNAASTPLDFLIDISGYFK